MRRAVALALGLVLALLSRGAAQSQRFNANLVVVGHVNTCASGPTGTTGNAYACSLELSPLAYTVGTHYGFKADVANTGAATINFNGLGVVALKKVTNGITTDLDANDLRAGQFVEVVYDGTNFQVLSALSRGSQTIASGAIALATSAIASGTCATAQTAAAPGTATTDVIQASFNADVTGVTGYTPATTGTLRIDVWPTANTVNLKVCNGTSSAITPGAVTVNFRVVR